MNGGGGNDDNEEQGTETAQGKRSPIRMGWIVTYLVIGLLIYISYYTILNVKQYQHKDKDIIFTRNTLMMYMISASAALFIGSGAAVYVGQPTIGAILLLISLIVDFVVGGVVGTEVEIGSGETVDTVYDGPLTWATYGTVAFKAILLFVVGFMAGAAEDKRGEKIRGFLQKRVIPSAEFGGDE